MDGVNAVNTALSYIRFNNLHAMNVGSQAEANGDITVSSIGGGTVYDKIAAGGSMSLQCHFTIPANHDGYIESWTPGILTDKKDTTARAFLRATVDWDTRILLPGIYHFQDIAIEQSGTFTRKFDIPLRLPGKCDVKVSAQELGGTGVTEASASIDLWYVSTQL